MAGGGFTQKIDARRGDEIGDLMAASTEEMAYRSNQVNLSAEELSRLSADLSTMVNRFKVAEA